MDESSRTPGIPTGLRMRHLLTLALEGHFGITSAYAWWMNGQDLIFWCGEDLPRAREVRVRVDLKTAGTLVDCMVTIVDTLPPSLTTIHHGYVFVGRYRLVSDLDRPTFEKGLRRANPLLDEHGPDLMPPLFPRRSEGQRADRSTRADPTRPRGGDKPTASGAPAIGDLQAKRRLAEATEILRRQARSRTPTHPQAASVGEPVHAEHKAPTPGEPPPERRTVRGGLGAKPQPEPDPRAPGQGRSTSSNRGFPVVPAGHARGERRSELLPHLARRGPGSSDSFDAASTTPTRYSGDSPEERTFSSSGRPTGSARLPEKDLRTQPTAPGLTPWKDTRKQWAESAASHSAMREVGPDERLGLMVGPGAPPTLLVQADHPLVLRRCLKIRQRVVMLTAAPTRGLSPGQQVQILLRLPDATFLEMPGVVMRADENETRLGVENLRDALLQPLLMALQDR